jgi:NAD(P)-dependent dehydrogenase (short-subunit alcohol dehydrogenase family)
MELGLEGKVAIVTGGARGIGAAIVEGFIKEGAHTIIADTRFETACEFLEKIRESGKTAIVVKTDVTRQDDADKLAATAIEKFGKIDILVNNAGVMRNYPFLEIKEEEIDIVYNVNTKGVYRLCQAVLPHMIAANYGKVVNIASISGKMAFETEGCYVPSKFAVIGLTQVLALEMAKHNINVNAVCPGIVRTPMWEQILDSLSVKEGRDREDIFKDWCSPIPLGRPQDPVDIANIVLFLSSDASRDITGESVNVCGGQRMD